MAWAFDALLRLLWNWNRITAWSVYNMNGNHLSGYLGKTIIVQCGPIHIAQRCLLFTCVGTRFERCPLDCILRAGLYLHVIYKWGRGKHLSVALSFSHRTSPEMKSNGLLICIMCLANLASSSFASFHLIIRFLILAAIKNWQLRKGALR